MNQNLQYPTPRNQENMRHLDCSRLAEVVYSADKCHVQFWDWPVDDSKKCSWTSISSIWSLGPPYPLVKWQMFISITSYGKHAETYKKPEQIFTPQKSKMKRNKIWNWNLSNYQPILYFTHQKEMLYDSENSDFQASICEHNLI